jgi:catechol 2,3-dioxygenase-like lactoylglutathione lyase family enzyme
MAWYLADVVSDGADVMITTHLVEAGSADEAYAKAMALGEDTDGFVGLHDLTEIQEPLVDGAELAFQTRPGAQAATLVVKKEQLGIFGAPSPDDAPELPDLRPPQIATIHHAQIMIAPGGEAEARRFYGEILGMREIEKPEVLRQRGGVWFVAGDRQLHIGVEDPGVERAQTRAHVAYETTKLDALRARLERANIALKDGEPVDGLRRFELRDPFGNRVEILGR